MSWRSEPDRYGAVAIVLHWVSAAAILTLFGLGFAAANAGDPSVQAALLRGHVPLGVLVLVLTLGRIAWWLVDRRPEPLAGLPRWQDRMERVVRVMLYGLVLLAAISGLGTLVLSGAAAVLFFGAPGPLPEFWTVPPMTVHFLAVVLLLCLAALHIAAAIYHQLYRQDRLLARMWR